MAKAEKPDNGIVKTVETVSYQRGNSLVAAFRRDILPTQEGAELKTRWSFNLLQIAAQNNVPLPDPSGANPLGNTEVFAQGDLECDQVAEKILDAIDTMREKVQELENNAASVFSNLGTV